MPRGGMDVRFPRRELGPNGRLTPGFRWRPQHCPRKRRVLVKVKLEANVSSPPQPQWAWGLPLWSHERIVWWCWTLVQRPTLCASVGLRTIIVSWNGVGFKGSLPIPPKQDSVLGMDALGRYAMQRILQRGSLGIRACPLRLRREGAIQRYCVTAPWKLLVGNWIFCAARWIYADGGRRDP